METEVQKPNYEILTCRVSEGNILRTYNSQLGSVLKLECEKSEANKNRKAKANIIIAVLREGTWDSAGILFTPSGKQYVAYSRCSPKDQFDRVTGRETAVGRALRAKYEEDNFLEEKKRRKKLSGKFLILPFPHARPELLKVSLFVPKDGELVFIGTETISIPDWLLTPAPEKKQEEAEAKEQQG